MKIQLEQLKDTVMTFLNSISYCELKTNQEISKKIFDLIETVEIIPNGNIEFLRKSMIPGFDVNFLLRNTKKI